MLSVPELIQLNRELRQSFTSCLEDHKGSSEVGKLWPLVYLAVQVMRLNESVELLTECGHGREAGILLRSMFEAMVNAMWISKDIDARIERYVDHQYVIAEKYRNVVKRWKNIEQFPEIERKKYEEESELIHREVERINKKYEISSKSEYWSGTTLQAMATDLGLHEWYDQIYFIYSDIMHSSIAGAHDYVSQIPSGEIFFTVGPKFEQADVCLREAYFYLTATFEVANDCIGLGMEDQLDIAWGNMPQVIPGIPDIRHHLQKS